MGFGVVIALGIVIAVIFILLGALIGAVFLRFAIKWAMKFKIAYGQAFKTVLVSSFAGILLSLVMALGYYGGAYSQGGMAQVEILLKDSSTGLLFNAASAVMSFFLGATVYGQMIKYPESGEPIGFRKGIRVSLFQMLLGFLIVLPLVLVSLILGGFFASH